MATANSMLARASTGETATLPAIHQSNMANGDRKAMPSQIQTKRKSHQVLPNPEKRFLPNPLHTSGQE